MSICFIYTRVIIGFSAVFTLHCDYDSSSLFFGHRNKIIINKAILNDGWWFFTRIDHQVKGNCRAHSNLIKLLLLLAPGRLEFIHLWWTLDLPDTSGRSNLLSHYFFWLQGDSNSRPRPYERRALTCWATEPFVHRWGRDSNPRDVTVWLVSSELTSTTHPPHHQYFQYNKKIVWWLYIQLLLNFKNKSIHFQADISNFYSLEENNGRWSMR